MAIRIHDLRKEKGMTQGQLADKLNVRISTISQWENDQRSPAARLLPALAAALGCSIDDLFRPVPERKEAAHAMAAAPERAASPAADAGTAEA